MDGEPISDALSETVSLARPASLRDYIPLQGIRGGKSIMGEGRYPLGAQMNPARIAWYVLVAVVVVWVALVLMLVQIGMVEALACGIPMILIGVILSVLFWYLFGLGKDR
jgi:hypothetical protein